MNDQETLEVYNQQADKYVDLVKDGDGSPNLHRFIDLITAGGHVLDLGCGPGMDAAIMQKRGLSVDAIDGSEEMVELARRTFNVQARHAYFEDIVSNDLYDGIWANFSLLHAAPDAFQRILSALHEALKSDGILHLGMKTGSGTARDRLGRFYAYYSGDELATCLQQAGFEVTETETGEGIGLAGGIDPWVTLLAIGRK